MIDDAFVNAFAVHSIHLLNIMSPSRTLDRPLGIRSQTGYAKRKYKCGGAPSLVAPNHLQRQFDVQ
jgi:hypothetical protein